MKNFISNQINKKETIVNEMDNFIDIFNTAIKNNKLSINTVDDKFKRLSPSQLYLIQVQAIQDGYTLTEHQDNATSFTYKLKNR